MTTQILALKLLRAHPAGLTTAEIVRLSRGKIGWEKVFVKMERLVDLGYAEDAAVPATANYPIGQTRYTLSDGGRGALREALEAAVA